MKTKEELTALKEEVETLSRKLRELTPEELKQVTGGSGKVPLYEPSLEWIEYIIPQNDPQD